MTSKRKKPAKELAGPFRDTIKELVGPFRDTIPEAFRRM